jgi:hypothetical protein
MWKKRRGCRHNTTYPTLRDGGRVPSSRPREGILPRADALHARSAHIPKGAKTATQSYHRQAALGKSSVINSIDLTDKL